jgi:hypothetical protein
MDIPELYHYGREGYWFSMTQFYIYLIDGIYQVSATIGQVVSPLIGHY